LFGEGFLSKYANRVNTESVFGIEVPTYDCTTNDDPLNSLFLFEQQTGPVGGLLYLALLAVLLRAAGKASQPVRGLALAFVVVGIMFGFISGNWLLSFGDSFDRYSFIFFAAMLYCPCQNEYELDPHG